MFYADAVGLPLVKETLERIGVKPARLLCECVDAGQPLAKFFGSQAKKAKL